MALGARNRAHSQPALDPGEDVRLEGGWAGRSTLKLGSWCVWLVISSGTVQIRFDYCLLCHIYM